MGPGTVDLVPTGVFFNQFSYGIVSGFAGGATNILIQP
jgi:hypothetical protein